MRVTLDFADEADGLRELQRAVSFARELRDMGFTVSVTGDLDVTARWEVDDAKVEAALADLPPDIRNATSLENR